MNIESLGVNPFREKDSETTSIEIVKSSSNKVIFNNLKAPTSKFLNYLIQEVLKKGDKFIVFNPDSREAYMRYANIQHQATVNSCLKDLRDNGVLAYTNVKYYFWLNSNILK